MLTKGLYSLQHTCIYQYWGTSATFLHVGKGQYSLHHMYQYWCTSATLLHVGKGQYSLHHMYQYWCTSATLLHVGKGEIFSSAYIPILVYLCHFTTCWQRGNILFSICTNIDVPLPLYYMLAKGNILFSICTNIGVSLPLYYMFVIGQYSLQHMYQYWCTSATLLHVDKGALFSSAYMYIPILVYLCHFATSWQGAIFSSPYEPILVYLCHLTTCWQRGNILFSICTNIDVPLPLYYMLAKGNILFSICTNIGVPLPLYYMLAKGQYSLQHMYQYWCTSATLLHVGNRAIFSSAYVPILVYLCHFTTCWQRGNILFSICTNIDVPLPLYYMLAIGQYSLHHMYQYWCTSATLLHVGKGQYSLQRKCHYLCSPLHLNYSHVVTGKQYSLVYVPMK